MSEQRETETVEGGCLCGQVRYVAKAAPLGQTNCHCRDCRRAVGAASVAWVIFPVEGVVFPKEEPRWFRSSSWAERGFCPRCGTSLTYRRDSRPEDIDVITATLDDPEALAPLAEIWVAERLGWTTLDPDLPHYPASSRQTP